MVDMPLNQIKPKQFYLQNKLICKLYYPIENIFKGYN